MTAYEEHKAAVSIAVGRIEQLRDMVREATREAESCTAVIHAATGDDSPSDAGRMALERVASIGGRLDAMVAELEEARNDMERFGTGW